jgi:hypothetical protein
MAEDRDYYGGPIGPGDFAKNIESGWLGRVEAIRTDADGLRMAEMIGVDLLAWKVAGNALMDSLTADDRQWHHVGDLYVKFPGNQVSPAL